MLPIILRASLKHTKLKSAGKTGMTTITNLQSIIRLKVWPGAYFLFKFASCRASVQVINKPCTQEKKYKGGLSLFNAVKIFNLTSLFIFNKITC